MKKVNFIHIEKDEIQKTSYELSTCISKKLKGEILNRIDLINDDKSTVYLLALELVPKDYLSDEIFITSNYFELFRIVQSYFDNKSIKKYIGDIHLFEFSNFEDAYKVALYMREVNPLCYDKNILVK